MGQRSWGATPQEGLGDGIGQWPWGILRPPGPRSIQLKGRVAVMERSGDTTGGSRPRQARAAGAFYPASRPYWAMSQAIRLGHSPQPRVAVRKARNEGVARRRVCVAVVKRSDTSRESLGDVSACATGA